MEEKMGVVEIMEVIEGLKILGVFGKKVGADGKVGLEDLQHVMALAQEAGKLTAAVQGSEKVLGEAKDLDQEEVMQVIAKLYEAIAAVKAA